MDKGSILNFLRKNKLGTIELGDTEDRIIEIFGKPEDTSIMQEPYKILKYKDVQLTFSNGILSGIGIYIYDSEVELPSQIEDCEGILKSRTVDDFSNYLYKERIPFNLNKELTFSDQICLKITNGADIIFDKNEGLSKIVLWHK